MAKQYGSKEIRNFGLFGHRGCGKTSLAEAILFDCKVTNRLGSVDAKTSVFDYTDEEQGRGFSIASMPAWVEWNKHKFNYVDTPGDLNFMFEAHNAMAVSDLMVMVVSAADGVGVGTEKLWLKADTVQKPRVIFINKLDRERTSAENTLTEIKESFAKSQIAAVQYPIGKDANFEGVVDLLSMKAYYFAKDGSGKMEAKDLPDDLADAVSSARENLIEKVAETDDELTETFLETLELSQEDLEKGLKNAIIKGKMVPVLYGSATSNIGIQPLLQFLITYGPTPLDGAPLQATSTSGEAVEIDRSEDGPFAAAVFKTIQGRNGKYSIFRVLRGSANSNEDAYNGTKDSSERLGSLLQLRGKNPDSVDKVVAGDFVALAKLKVTETGDTLCTSQEPFSFNMFKKPTPIISFALQGEEDKIIQGLNRLSEEDYAMVLERDPQTNQVLLRGQGQIHVEVLIEKLRNQSKLEVDLLPPTVAYRETIRGTANNVEGKLKKQSGGRGQFAVCFIDMKPSEPGEGFVFENGIVGGVIPRQYIPAVEKGISEASAAGPLAGYPCIDFHVRLHDGKTHDVDSSEQAFKMAGIFAFRNAIEKCRPVLLEPFMELEITVPADCQGTVTGDLNSRRGRLEGTEYRGKNVTIKAKVPEAEILTYANQLTSMTEGRGTFSMEPAHYEQVPGMIQDKIVAEAKARAEQEG